MFGIKVCFVIYFSNKKDSLGSIYGHAYVVSTTNLNKVIAALVKQVRGITLQPISLNGYINFAGLKHLG